MHQARALGLGLRAYACYRDGVIILYGARGSDAANADVVKLVQLVQRVIGAYYRDGEVCNARWYRDGAIAVIHYAVAEGDRAQIGAHRRVVGQAEGNGQRTCGCAAQCHVVHQARALGLGLRAYGAYYWIYIKSCTILFINTNIIWMFYNKSVNIRIKTSNVGYI